MVLQVLVAVSDHGPAAIPAAATHDMHGVDGEGIRSAHHGSDVGIVLEVLDGDMQGMPALIDVPFDRFPAPVAVGIDDVATIPFREQLGIVLLRLRALRDRALPRADAVAAFVPLGRALACLYRLLRR